MSACFTSPDLIFAALPAATFCTYRLAACLCWLLHLPCSDSSTLDDTPAAVQHGLEKMRDAAVEWQAAFANHIM
jgi:hypothetical protein